MAIRKLIDTAEWNALQRRMQERRWLFAASFIVVMGLVLTFLAKTQSREGIEELIRDKEIVNLGALESSRDLIPVLSVVYSDPADQKLAAEHIYTYILQQRARSLTGVSIRNVGQLNTAALSVSAQKAESGGIAFQERLVRSRARLGMNPDGDIIHDTLAIRQATPQGAYHISGRVIGTDGKPMAGINLTLSGTRWGEERTDATGHYRFDGLTRGDTVVVRPIKKYYAFTPKEFTVISGDLQHNFRAREHRLSLLNGMNDLQKLKPRLIARSPLTFTWKFWSLSLLYLVGFYGLHIFWFRRRFRGDAVLLPILHLFTGLALMLMLSIPDPLRDLIQAQGFVAGVAGGCILTGFTSRFDFQRNFWRKRPFFWLAGGVLVATILFFVGSGPTGSQAKVNLILPVIGSVQPVELIKLFLVLFLAGYFARNWKLLRELKQREGIPSFLKRLEIPRYRYLVPVAAGIFVALSIFYLLKDMGPALVIGCVFLLLYGIVRNRWIAVGVGFIVLITGFWYAYHTNAVPMVADRIEMLLSPWENFASGGEHLAHAYWALASGGVMGQGLGFGSPNVIPAAHTDMVLSVFGEEMGLLGLIGLFTLYAALIHRSLFISMRADGIYSLFLGLSITLITLFEIALIAGGAFGLFPLSGVATPFISFGKSSMLVNCILIGILMSISAKSGNDEQYKTQRRHFKKPVQFLMVLTVIIFAVFIAKAAYVQTVADDEWVIKPALVVRGNGERAYTYNPRILEARREIVRGTIYDRNGIPLATSNWDELEHYRDVYEKMGVDISKVARTDARYYPFEALTFYLLGDIKTRVKWGATNSLYAEHAYLSHLRGYDNYPQLVEKRKDEGYETEPIVRYNYVELLPLVRSGPQGLDAQAILKRYRDVYLTIDIRLQQGVADILQRLSPDDKTASVVILDVATGDVLASVTSPLPEIAFADPSAAHIDENLFDRGFGKGAKPPGSTFKLVTAIAALKQDPKARSWSYTVHKNDRYARDGEPTGRVDMRRAIIASSNVYFAALARDVVGADSLLQTLEAFGFGVGDPGLSRNQKIALLNEPDNLRQSGFGQGPVTASPLQVALVAATIANRGARPDVHWIKDPTRLRRPPRYIMVPHHAGALGEYMRWAVTAREGTAHLLNEISVPVAGKTGTAEEVQWVERRGYRFRQKVNHAWFVGYIPYTEPGTPVLSPKLALSVLIEEGGLGGQVAAPIAGAITEEIAALGIIEGY